MPAQKLTELCYLLAFPDSTEKRDLRAAKGTPEPGEQIRGLKDAPYFQPVDVHVKTLGQVEVQAGGVQVSVTRQRFDDRIQIVECRFQMADVFSLEAIQQREIIQRTLTERFVPVEHRTNGMYEEYVILLTVDAKPAPDKFIERNAGGLARFIRTQHEVFDQREIDEILASRVRYSKQDMTLVDWEAALIIAPNGDFQSDIELLKVGNYQLLRYRMLDESIDARLRTINQNFRSNPGRVLQSGPTRGQIRDIVQHRLEVMLDFEHTEQNLLLIGDWYTAQLYHIIRDEFYLEEWKEAVKSKLDNLESIIETIRENFTLSWQSLMETAQITGWLILLIGYFILFFMDTGLLKGP